MSVAEVIHEVDSSRGRDNYESKQAWKKALYSTDNDREKVLVAMGWIAANGNHGGLTPKEFSKWVGKPLHAISGRFGELAELGLIKRTGYVRDGSRAWERVLPPFVDPRVDH